MSGSARKFKSLWDMKEETQPPAEISENNALPEKECHSKFPGGHSPKWSDLEAANVSKSKDCSRWSSWEPLHGSSIIQMQKDDSVNSGQKIPTSPAFDGGGCQNNSRSPDGSWSLSHRGKGQVRGRGRGRSRSRSRSRGRSRSRSRSRVRDRSRSQSRSPLRDRRRESHGWTDRRSGSRISSQPCRDFAVGKCRRGSQCWFSHQDILNGRDGRRSENDLAERWRSRSEHGGVSKYGDNKGPVDYSLDKFSDGYGKCYGEGEPPRDGSKNTLCCKDFLKGRCNRGASCRYPHHGASVDNYDRGNRNASYDHDRKRQSNRSGKVPCKYFTIGKCHRNDCRFSHDDPTSGNFDGRLHDDRRGHNLDDKNKSWNGPTWSDATVFSDIAKSTGWGDGSVGNTNFQDPTAAEKQTDDRGGHTLKNESRTWGGPGWKDKASERDGYLSPHRVSGSNGGDMGTTEFMGMKQMIDREEFQLIPEGSQLHTLDGISMHVGEQNIVQEASGHRHATTVMPPKVPESSYIQQHHGLGGDNTTIAGDSNALNEVKVSEIFTHPVKVSENFTHPVLVPGQNFNQNGDSMGSQPPTSLSRTDQSHHLLPPNPSNGNDIDLNVSAKDMFSPLNLQSQTQIHHKEAVKTPEMLELKVPQVMPEICQNVVISEQVAQITNLPASSIQICPNGQLPQPFVVINHPNAQGLVHSLPSSECGVPPIDLMVVQPNPARRSQVHSMEPSKPDNSHKPPGFLSNSIEQDDQMSLECSYPVLTGDPNSSEVHESGVSEEKYHRSPKLKHQEPVANPEINGNNEITAGKSMQEQGNFHSGTVDAHGKVEEGDSSKDEKAMRLFKIALVEFVKEILKPTWKEGQMSREVHKTIVKKAVDKVTSTIQGIQIPKTQDKIDQYLSFSKPKITKLVQAYVDRFLRS